MVLLPNPFFALTLRWRATPQNTRTMLRPVLRDCAGIGLRMTTAAHRLFALVLLQEIEAPGDDGASHAGELAYLRRIIGEENRFDPYWPVEPLRVQYLDALARDEVGLHARCAFPPGSGH